MLLKVDLCSTKSLNNCQPAPCMHAYLSSKIMPQLSLRMKALALAVYYAAVVHLAVHSLYEPPLRFLVCLVQVMMPMSPRQPSSAGSIRNNPGPITKSAQGLKSPRATVSSALPSAQIILVRRALCYHCCMWLPCTSVLMLASPLKIKLADY